MNFRWSRLCCIALACAALAAGCARKSERDAAMEAWRAEPGHKQMVSGVAFSSDGKLLYSLDYDGKVITWDVASGRVVRTMQAQNQMVCALALSADGKMLATSSFDKTVKVFDVETGKELRTLTGFIREVCGLAFSPDGRRLATTDNHGVARLWDTSTWDVLHKWGGPPYIKREEFSANGDPMFTADGKRIVIQGPARGVWIFDSATTQVVRQLKLSLAPGENPRVGMGPVTLTHDGRAIVATDFSGRVIRWDTRNWKDTSVTMSGIPSRFGRIWPRLIATSPDDRLLALAVGEKAYTVDLATGKKIATLAGHTGGVRVMAFSADGKWLATGGNDCVVMLWDVTTGRAIRSFGTRPPPREMTEDY